MATPDPTTEQSRTAFCALDSLDDSANLKQVEETSIELLSSETIWPQATG